MQGKRIRVLVVDDSALMRKILTELLSSDPAIEVVGTAPDPYIAKDKIRDLQPDVMTLDVEMPRMDGITFLEKVMAVHPMPVVMVSTLTQRGCEVTMKALEIGAVDFFSKPTLDTASGIAECASTIIEKVKAAACARISTRAIPARHTPITSSFNTGYRTTHQIIAIGASTGGTEAIREVLVQLPADSPGIVIVQHMPPGFTASFANRLDGLSAIRVKEAQDGDRVIPGQALLAPGNFHMALRRSGADFSVRVYSDEAVNRHRPAVDVLFNSVAEGAGHNAVGVLLTGMGDDGARGLKKMRDAGAHTIAQDEASCVVFGMPREAILRGGAEFILPLNKVAGEMLRLAGSPNTMPSASSSAA